MSSPVSLRQAVGKGYDKFMTCRQFYRMVKGSKGSKKSKTAALWYIFYMMKYPDANTLVIKKTYRSLENSAYAELLWAIDRLGVNAYWKASVSPLEITYLPTGQVILFNGMDDPMKLASITVRKGYLCWVWFEEFTDITDQDAFEKIQMSIRGYIPPETGLFKQITGTFNPWSERSWIKSAFFDKKRDDTLAMTTTFRDNEFLGDDDVKRYEDLYTTNPRMARVVCDGDWGIAAGLIYENWTTEDFDYRDILKNPHVKPSFGLDFGYKISYNAFVAILVDVDARTLWVYDEMYERGMTNLDIAKRITAMGYADEQIFADSAEPKSIFELQAGLTEEDMDERGDRFVKTWALPNIRPALKGPDSVMNGIQRLQSFKMIVSPDCVNFIMELKNYAFAQDQFGNYINKPIKDFDHCLIAGTKVLTENGEEPIEEVLAGESVQTHLGWRRVTASGITGFNKQVLKITLSDGTSLTGTFNHPVVTVNGLVYLRDLRIKDTLICKAVSHNERSEGAVFDSYREGELEEKRGSSALRAFVHRVLENSASVRPFSIPTSRGLELPIVLKQVVSVEYAGIAETVYDLTVEEAHDFFAENILVLNCMDAARYGLDKFFVRAHGYVAEAKGIDGGPHAQGPSTGKRSKRVVSSI